MKKFLIPVGDNFVLRIDAESTDETLDEFITRVKLHGVSLENLDTIRDQIIVKED